MQKDYEYDAIVVGSGMTGGWAAKELCEAGLKTIVLERGRNVEHGKDYPTTNLNPWELPNNGITSEEDRKTSPIQSQCYAYRESTKHFFVNDTDHPYQTPENQEYRWIRGYQVGGKSLIWGRQVYRWSDLDFEANAKDGHGIDWPIRYKDIAPWYDHVEKFVGVTGQKEGIPHLPDGQFLPPMEMNCVEKHVREQIKKSYEDRTLIIGRAAHLTQQIGQRGPCQFRNKCHTGCPFGGYFSSNSGTLPAAAATGNLTLRPFSIVESLIYDEEKDKVVGVRIVDSETNTTYEYRAKIVFLCAGTIASTGILLNSKSNRYPGGLGSDSEALGKYLMDHPFQSGASASFDGWEDQIYHGGRPNGIYVPRFRNVNDVHPDFIRGYGMQGGGYRDGYGGDLAQNDFGADFKAGLSQPGTWKLGLGGWGEQLPDANNRIELTDDKDKWGLPILKISAKFGENEMKMKEDMAISAAEMLEKAGGKDIQTYNNKEQAPGFCIHEMGTARMGHSSKNSVLNKFNQLWDSPNVFVTDGACMASSACQNPSITYMALTARAVNYAVSQLNEQNL